MKWSAAACPKRTERRAAPKPGRIPSGDRPRYSVGEGWTKPTERRAEGLKS